MTSDGILSFEVTLSAKSSEEIKGLIDDAKEIEESKRKEREDLKQLKAKQRAEKQAAKEANKIELPDGRKVTQKQYQRMLERKRIRDEKAEEQAIQESIANESKAAEQDVIDQVPEIEEINKKIKDLLDDIDSQGIGNLRAFASNPEGMVQNKLIQVLGMAGPYGAIASAIIAMIIASPEIAKAIIEMLAVKGGPLNLDFRYSLEEQLGQEFDRMLQFKRITGDNPIIQVDTHGYIAGDEAFSGNSLVDSEITRTARISIKHRSLGFTSGI